MDVEGQKLEGVIGPFDEKSNVVLICEAEGGRCLIEIMFESDFSLSHLRSIRVIDSIFDLKIIPSSHKNHYCTIIDLYDLIGSCSARTLSRSEAESKF